ncbi:hypothetical protein E4U61_007365 [Claviceps capensis]|nr:hypothetical protein E4U61_007365 [Claviceps capensis]
MKLSPAFGFGISATSATVLRHVVCDFKIRRSGSQQGSLGQVSGGCTRFGDLEQVTFRLEDGKLRDSEDHGCWWTPSSTFGVSTVTKDCPANLDGAYEFPHLIIPVDKSNPDKAYGTSFFGEVTPSRSSISNFDIPVSDRNKTYTLILLFPNQSQLETSS